MTEVLRYRNRIADTTASTASPLSLAGVLPVGYASYQTFAVGGPAASLNGRKVTVHIETTDGSVWQTCEATYASTGTLTIGTILDGSSGPGVSVFPFPAGTKRVYMVGDARRFEKSLLHVGMVATLPSTTTAGWQVVPYNSVVEDTHSWWNASTNRYTPQVAGWYQCTIAASGSATGLNTGGFRKNGATDYFVGVDLAAASLRVAATMLLFFNGTTDYIEFMVYTTAVRGYTVDTIGQIVGPIL